MHKRFIFVLFMSLTLFACSKTNSINHTEITKADDASLQTNEKIYWVNSLKSKCADTGSMECLQIQQGNELKPDGCNNFTGVIKSLDVNKIIFGAIATTRKLCVDMDISDRFHQNMSNVHSYSLKALKLHFYDKEGNELFVFQKID